ncbi:MAG: lipoprotein, partial [Flavobacterium sp.]
MKKIIVTTVAILLLIGCQKAKKEDTIQGKIEKEQIAVV